MTIPHLEETDMAVPTSETLAARNPYGLHRASWLVPIASPPIENGAVLTAGDRILLAGPYRKIKAESPPGTHLQDHGNVALIPGLVNGHCHLELSAFQGRIAFPKGGFSEWLNELLPMKSTMTEKILQDGFHEGLRRLTLGGTILCGDITNGLCPRPKPSHCFPARLDFLELIGFNHMSLRSAMEGGGFEDIIRNADDPSVSLAAHACYSTSAPVITEAKEWCRRKGKVFTIHTAEHTEEVELLRSGTGYCRALLETLGKWPPCWAPPDMTPVGYLNKLGVLDDRTLLVHAVHMTETDWEIVAGKSAAVCFCPRSNRNLGVGKARIPSAIRHGILSCLGTDSLASNVDLNLFAEAAQALRDHPSVPAGVFLQMLTLGGARSLGRDTEYGTIEPGKMAAILAVSVHDVRSPSQIAEAIIHQGNEGAIQWCKHPASD